MDVWPDVVPQSLRETASQRTARMAERYFEKGHFGKKSILDRSRKTSGGDVMRTHLSLRGLVFCCLLVFAGNLSAQTTDDLFNGNVLHEIRLTVNPKDWAQLKTDYLGNTYFAADFHWNFNGRDIYIPGVAIRQRGQGSRSPVKPSIRVEFDRFESQKTL